MKWVTALTVDAKAKRRMLCLTRKLDNEGIGEWYPCFYRHLRLEMEKYFEAKKHIRIAEKSTDWEEFSRKYPALCRLKCRNLEGGVAYAMDKSRLSIRLIPPYSDEHRAAARAYAKEHGFQPVQSVQDIA